MAIANASYHSAVELFRHVAGIVGFPSVALSVSSSAFEGSFGSASALQYTKIGPTTFFQFSPAGMLQQAPPA